MNTGTQAAFTGLNERILPSGLHKFAKGNAKGERRFAKPVYGFFTLDKEKLYFGLELRWKFSLLRKIQLFRCLLQEQRESHLHDFYAS